MHIAFQNNGPSGSGRHGLGIALLKYFVFLLVDSDTAEAHIVSANESLDGDITGDASHSARSTRSQRSEGSQAPKKKSMRKNSGDGRRSRPATVQASPSATPGGISSPSVSVRSADDEAAVDVPR